MEDFELFWNYSEKTNFPGTVTLDSSKFVWIVILVIPNNYQHVYPRIGLIEFFQLH